MSDQPVIRSAEEIEAELATPEQPQDEVQSEGGEETIDAAEQQRLDDEEAASRRGWVPKDQYKGDPRKWKDARTFLESGERFASNLQREIEYLRNRISDFEGTKKQFQKFYEDALAKKDAELSEAINSLRVQRTQAIREGDDHTAVELEDRIDALREQRKEVKKIEPEAKPAVQPDADNPVLQEWVEDGNQWFKEDKKLAAYAITLGEQMIAEGETLRGRKFLDKLRQRIEDDFPRKFRQESKQERPNGAEGSTTTRSTSANKAYGGKTEKDLPPEDLALMRQFIKEGWTTKEKFLAGYFGRNS